VALGLCIAVVLAVGGVGVAGGVGQGILQVATLQQVHCSLQCEVRVGFLSQAVPGLSEEAFTSYIMQLVLPTRGAPFRYLPPPPPSPPPSGVGALHVSKSVDTQDWCEWPVTGLVGDLW